jgi:hypothetical protein
MDNGIKRAKMNEEGDVVEEENRKGEIVLRP